MEPVAVQLGRLGLGASGSKYEAKHHPHLFVLPVDLLNPEKLLCGSSEGT